MENKTNFIMNLSKRQKSRHFARQAYEEFKQLKSLCHKKKTYKFSDSDIEWNNIPVLKPIECSTKHVLTDYLSISSNTQADSDLHSIVNNFDWKENVPLDKSLENDSSETDFSEINLPKKVKVSNKMIQSLAEWALLHNITHSALDNLLFRLNEFVDDLPLKSKTILHTPRQVNTLSLDNGLYTHFGIAKSLFKILNDLNENVILILKIDVNIDGVPIYKSSGICLWPIFVRCIDIKNKNPFVVGIFTGTGKPKPLDLYLQEFLCELNVLSTNGFFYNRQQIKIKLNAFICDAPARAYLKCCTSHNGKYGCEKCSVEGISISHRMIYKNIFALRRTDQSFYNQVDEDHHKEICIVWLNLLKLQKQKLYQQNGLIKKVLNAFGLITKAPTKLKKLFYQSKFLIQRSGSSMIPEYYINIIHIKKLALTYQKLYIHLI